MMTALLCVSFCFASACKDGEQESQLPEEEQPAEEQPTDEPVYIEGREVITAEQVNTFGEEYIRLYGRTYVASKQLYLENASTGAEICFYGTQLSAAFVSASVTMYCSVFVDGGSEGQFLPITRNKSYLLAEGLAEGVHTVRVIKATSSQNGKLGIRSFATDGSFLRPEATQPLSIEFVGGSITVGAGVYGSGSDLCTVDNSDASKSYAYLTAQALNADCSLVATEGICVKAKKALQVNMCEMYTYVSSTNHSLYSFPKTHDVVVVAMGTNDAWAYTGSLADQFAEDYLQLLTLIREKNPDAQIVCIYGMMGTNAELLKGLNSAIEAAEDPKISYCALPADNNGAGGHPSLAGAKKQSETLTAYLRQLLG